MTVVEGEVPQPTALSAAAVANGHDTSPVDPLVKLGDDVFLLVLELLPPLELPKLCGVSQLWRDHLYNSDKLWRKACRELGVDLREWAHSVGETAALGKDEPYLPPDVSDYDRVVKEDKLGTSGFDCPRASTCR